MSNLKDLIKNPTSAELQLVAAYGELKEAPARERAFTAFAATGLPHRRMEAWKWTDFKTRLATFAERSAPCKDPFADVEGHAISLSNGAISGLENLPDGIRAFVKEDAQAFAGAEDIPLGGLTAALVHATLMIEVTGVVETPLKLVFSGTGELGLARVVFVVRPNASVRVIESHLGGAAFNSALLSFGLQADAELTRTFVQPASPGEAVAITAEVHADARARFTQTALAFGGELARIETRGVHHDPEAHIEANAAYLAGDGFHVDFTSHIRHGARNCVTRQLTKGAVLKGGTGIFQGKFHVPRNVGQLTDADMQHNALLLEEGAVVNAKPELEIYADDVECAHGNTCGALDADALFYMRQRGIPEAAAKALLTEAFIAQALETADGSARAFMLEAARDWLNG